MSKSKDICFYFPYMEDSGVPMLFYRMANTLSKNNPNLQISVIDYIDGAMARNLLHFPNLKLIPFRSGEQVIPPNNSILVMQTFVPYYWPKELVLNNDQKLFFWNLHPQNLIPSLLPLPYLRNVPFNNFGIYKALATFYPKLIGNLKVFLKLLIDNKALYFMDRSNLDYTSKYLFYKIDNADFIPVPAGFNEDGVKPVERKLTGNTINVGWIGRLCDFKSYILVYTINKLAELVAKFPDKKFIYHIVGDGSYLAYIKKHIQTGNQISVIFHGAIAHQEIDRFIEENIDIVTAMGTSALEGAKLAKPTILLDFTFKRIKKDYIFRLLSTTKDYDLAHLISKADFLEGNQSLYEIFKNIIADYGLYAKEAKTYFDKHHNIKNVQQIFVEKALQTRLEYSMIDPSILRKGCILQFYNKVRKLNN